MELLPEQVIAVMIVRDRHIEGTPLAVLTLPRHLDVERTDVRVARGELGIGYTLPPELTMGLLGRAPLHFGHIGGEVGGYSAIAGEAVDDLAHLASDPQEHGVKLDPAAFSASFCHTFLLATV